MSNNIRIRARKRKLELDIVNIDIESKQFNTSFITEHNESADN